MVSSGFYNPSILNFILANFLYLFIRVRKCNTVVEAIPSSSSLFTSSVANITVNMSDEQRLFYTLMTGYEKAVRPARKASDAVVVKLGITLTQIMDIVRHEIK